MNWTLRLFLDPCISSIGEGQTVLRWLPKFRIILAICYLGGFILHVLDILNLRLHFTEMDSVWKTWIIFLAIFDLLTAIGLFRKKLWGELVFLLVAVAQLVAYTRFQQIFGQQEFLIRFHTVCLGTYGILKVLEACRKSETSTIIKYWTHWWTSLRNVTCATN